MRYFRCPVCAYPRLPEPPFNFSICPSCGTEFENDDYDQTHEELRRAWLAKGAPWFSPVRHPPAGWNAIAQLIAGGLGTEAQSRADVSYMTVAIRGRVLYRRATAQY